MAAATAAAGANKLLLGAASLTPGVLYPAEGSILKWRKFEFLAVDDGLDMFFNDGAREDLSEEEQREFSLENYPNFAEGFVRYVSTTPQVNLLYDFFDGSVTPEAIKSAYDKFTEAQFRNVAGSIAANTKAWEYGASFDDLTFTDFQYIVPEGVELVSGDPGDLITKVEVPDFDSDGNPTGYGRPIREDDGILGISRMQWQAEEAEAAGNVPMRPNRVHYLDPSHYGASYMNPPVYVSPVTGSGWMGIVDLLFPEMSPCKPHNTNLVDFEDIKEKISQAYANSPQDARLAQNPDCVIEKPYNRILERIASAGIQGLVSASIRIFISTHFLKSLPIFTKFAPQFPQNYSNIYAMYIVERMEEAFKQSTTQWLSPLQENEFWYSFLEQAVQSYGYMIDSEDNEIDVPPHVQDALDYLNDFQESYNYPNSDDLSEAKTLDDAPWYQMLESYQQDKNLEAVRQTEEQAKTILKEFVILELQIMSDKFISNLKPLDMQPDVNDLDYYYMSEFTAGSTLDLQKEFVETPVGLPTSGSNHYSNGAEFSLPDGSTYVGYYHAHHNAEEDRLMYMIGEEHSSESHDEIRPFANKIIVPIGDVPSWESGTIATDEQPFIIEKYIVVDGERKDPASAVTQIKGNKTGNISDYYPGTLEFEYPKATPILDEVRSGTVISPQKPAFDSNSTTTGPLGVPNAEGEVAPVGLKGQLGVRYGLSLKMKVGTSGTHTITTVEIDALDTPVSAFNGIPADSKILLCLLNKLKETARFKMLSRYIFSMKRVLGIMAIYNDMGFLPSIGEYTVAENDLYTNASKPGAYIEFETTYDSTTNGVQIDNAYPTYNRGWAAAENRDGFFDSPFFMKYDEWDQKTLANSVGTIRDLFRSHYYARDYQASEAIGTLTAQWVEQLKERFRISRANSFLPWWGKNRIRSNPYNNNGDLCTKKD
jgi:hypothetical protein